MASLYQHQYGLLHSKTRCMHGAVGLVICPCSPRGKEFPILRMLPELLYHCITVCISFLLMAVGKASASAAGRRADSRVVGVLAEPQWGGEQQCLH